MGSENTVIENIDNALGETLITISHAKRFNQWLFETISPYCQGEILEVGSGIGNISGYFINNGSRIHLSDVYAPYLEILDKRFGGQAKGISKVDIASPDLFSVNGSPIKKFDTVFSLNVIEHIQNDSLAIENMMSLLRPEGKLIVLVPAHKRLYNSLDKSFLHYRRYSKSGLLKIMPSGSELITSFYFNAMGIPSWFIGGTFQKMDRIPRRQMKFFDFFVPLWKVLDRIFLQRVGLSLIMVFKKK